MTTGLIIDTERLGRIASAQAAREHAQEVAGDDGNGSTAQVTRYVSPEVIASTAERYPGCRCEELGLVAGMPVAALVELEEGCAGTRQKAALHGFDVPSAGNGGGWVCDRLNAIRRSYVK